MKPKTEVDPVQLEDGTRLTPTERCVLTVLHRRDDNAPLTTSDIHMLIDEVTKKTVRESMHSLAQKELAETGVLAGENDGTALNDPLTAWITTHGDVVVEQAAPGAADNIGTRVSRLENRVEYLEEKLPEEDNEEFEELEREVEELEEKVDRHKTILENVKKVFAESDIDAESILSGN